jgi:hypothetical protein
MGYWLSVFVDHRPRDLGQVFVRALTMAVLFIPLAWAIGRDLADALQYSAIFIGLRFLMDLALLWNSRE